MIVRRISWVCVAGLGLGLLGCAGMDGQRAGRPWLASSPEPRSARAASVTPIGPTPTIRFAAHEDEADPETQTVPPELQNAPRSHAEPSSTLQPRTIHETLHPPGVTEAVEREPTPIMMDLTEALARAGGQSPQIAFASARYREAYARLKTARVLWLPSLRAGLSYNHHDGNLQASDGNILDVNRSSLQTGLGVQAVGAGTTPVPGVVAQFHAADAVFQPRIAGHAAGAGQAATQAATNDVLLATAMGYLDLLRTTQTLRIAQTTRDNSQQLADLTRHFAESGQGSYADASRAQTELVRRRNDVSRAEEARRVAAARLAELLSLDPTISILPAEPAIVPIELVSHEVPLTSLVATGLANRPELAEAQYLVCEAVSRYQRERYAPLVPSVLLGISQGGFGGGLGSTVDDFRSRFDFDAAVFWELRNFGVGERTRRDEAIARRDQAAARQAAAMDRVAREVVEAATQIQARQSQIAVAESGVEAAQAAYGQDLVRIREGEGLPIEVLLSLQALDEAQREYLRTLVDYNEAQFRLQRALGWPIQ